MSKQITYDEIKMHLLRKGFWPITSKKLTPATTNYLFIRGARIVTVIADDVTQAATVTKATGEERRAKNGKVVVDLPYVD